MLFDLTPLPEETVNYVAAIAPQLGPGTPMSGPLAVYAGSRFVSRPTRSGCDTDAAYDPSRPCQPVRQATVVAVAAPVYSSAGCDADAAYDPSRPCQPVRQAAVVAVAAPVYSAAGCDADAAFDPSRPCKPAVAATAPAPSVSSAGCDPDGAFDPSRPCLPPRPPGVAAQPAPVLAQALPPPIGYARPLQETRAQRASYDPGPPPGRWAIQVGAFANLSTAESAAESARSAAPDLLRTAKIELPATTPFGTRVAFRARLFGLSQTAAADACARLSGRGMACITVPPDRGSF